MANLTQKIIFPMQYMRITTGINELSHLGSNAIDNAGKDTGIDVVFAPFTGVVKKKYALGNTVWLESLEPVEFADGTVDFAVASFTHDNTISDLSVGQVIQQGQVFYQEGTSNAVGNHIHLEIGRGKFTGTGWYKNSYGSWVINNSYVPYAAFFITESTIILNGYGYPWRKEVVMQDKLTDFEGQTLHRHIEGKEISDYTKKNRVGKMTFDQARADIANKSATLMDLVAKAKVGQLTAADMIKHMPKEVRDVYVAPTPPVYEPVTEQLYRRK